MKKTNSNLAFAVLCMHIDNLEKRNDRFRIEQVEGSRLYHMLTTEEQKSIIDDKIENAIIAIIGKLSRGEITPMMLSEKSRRRSSYVYYLRWLKDVVLPEDPVKADKLAYEAYKSMLMNDLVVYKDSLDDYFSALFANRRKEYVYKEFKREIEQINGAMREVN